MAENTYLTALHGMEVISPHGDGEAIPSFNRKKYVDYFRQYYEKNITVFEALETGYNNAVDKEQYIYNMANAAVTAAVSELNGVKGRSKKDARLLDMNLCMVVYILPAILEYGGNSARPLTDELTRQWKEQFPKTNLSAASFDEIESGFHKKWCYITTAVCNTFHKPDDCYELTLLRGYRDHYLMQQPEGEEIIRRYYDVAPTIVKRINKLPEKKQIYRGIWDDYLAPCIAMIENNENESCKELYIKMVEDLQERYFYTEKQ